MATSKELDHQYRMAKLQSWTSISRAIIRLLMIGAVFESFFSEYFGNGFSN